MLVPITVRSLTLPFRPLHEVEIREREASDLSERIFRELDDVFAFLHFCFFLKVRSSHALAQMRLA